MKRLIFCPMTPGSSPDSLYKEKINSTGFIYLKLYENKKIENLQDIWNYFEKETRNDISPLFLSSFIKELADLYQIEQVIIGLLIENKMYLAKQGEVTCFIARGGKFGPILTGGSVSFGEVREGDNLYISSKENAEKIGKDQIHAILTSGIFIKDINGMFLKIITEEKKEIPTSTYVDNAQLPVKTHKGLPKVQLPTKENLLRVIHQVKEKAWARSEEEQADPGKIKKKKILFIASIILTGILLASLFVTIRETRNREREKILNATLITVQEQYDEASTLVDLNPPHARELLASAKVEISQLLSQFPKDSAEYKKAQNWYLKISEEESIAYKIYKLSSVPLFFDITFIKPEGEGSVISVFENTGVILDVKNQVIYTLTLDQKQAKLIAGKDIVKDAKGIAIYGKNSYIANSDGLIAINITSGKSNVIIPRDDKWGDIVSMSAYGANIYLLDASNNMVWKYTAGEQGFNPIDTYLSSDTQEDFSGAFSLVIDGNVWVVTEKGIYKFTRGVPQNFTYKGFSDAISDYGGLSAVEENNNLYVLDKSLSRIVVFDKEGTYQSQYQWENLKNTSTLYASEKDKKIYVIIGSKIYAVDMK